jgi:hypothetical protein
VDVNDIYDEFSDLLGVYALDAVDPDERERIELHLADCPRCRAEVAEHREVAGYLSHSGATAPEGVWDRIALELSPAAPPMRMAILPNGSAAPGSSAPASTVPEASPEAPADNVTPIGAARRRPSRATLAVLSIAACIIALLGVVAVGQAQRIGRGESVEEMATKAASDSKLKVELSGGDGSAQAVVGANGQGYLIMDGVAAPADGDVYQLWGKVDGAVLSLGTFGETGVVPFSVDPSHIGDIELFAVTEEKAPGVVASTQEPIMAGTV